MKFSKLTSEIKDATESLDRLACGAPGLMPNGTPRDEIVALLEAVKELAELVEDEVGLPIEKSDSGELANVVDRWMVNS